MPDQAITHNGVSCSRRDCPGTCTPGSSWGACPPRPRPLTITATLALQDGQTLQVSADTASGRIHWSDAWELIWQAKAEGLVRVEHGGPGTYGHADFYLPACAFCGEPLATDVIREEDQPAAPCCADTDACYERFQLLNHTAAPVSAGAVPRLGELASACTAASERARTTERLATPGSLHECSCGQLTITDTGRCPSCTAAVHARQGVQEQLFTPTAPQLAGQQGLSL